MKKESVNQFNQGMNLDLHPTVTPNSVLTDNLNGTFITYNGNEFCLQNDKGNKEVASLTEGYVPIGAKEYNGIIYIVSVKNAYENPEEQDEEKRIIKPEECITEIGTYPGVDWNPTLYKTIDPDDSSVKYYDKYEKELDLITPESEAEKENPRNCYTPLCNFNVGEDSEGYSEYGQPFRAKLGCSTITPVTIEIQPSYDGSVNLILTDDVNPVRMINSGFSVLPENKYKLVKRNQTEATNTYDENRLDELNLIRTTNILTNIDLIGVQPGGQFKGGNYTFYIKFGDADYNQTDVVAESGIVSIFRGTDCNPSTISGTVLDERTDKMIGLKIIGLNKTYSKIYIYYSREYSDTQGYRMTEYGVFKDPIDIKPDQDNESEEESEQTIWLTGYEQTESIGSEEIKIDYHTFDSARAEAQQQNMLFLGNLKMDETYKLYDNLKNLANSIETKLKATDTLKQVSYSYNATNSCTKENAEYYSVENIYNKLGYWPGEIYRFGIVFILKDGATTPVFNMPGGILEETNDGWAVNKSTTNNDYKKCLNNLGVFKLPEHNYFNGENIKPLHFEFTLPDIKADDFIRNNVIGYFYVRQKRIPITLCQGLTLGVDTRSHLPVTWNGHHWITQSFLSLNRKEINNPADRTIASTDGEHADLLPSLEYYGATSKIDNNSRNNSETKPFIKFAILRNAENDRTYNSKEEALEAVDSITSGTTYVGIDSDSSFDDVTAVYLYWFDPGGEAVMNQRTGKYSVNNATYSTGSVRFIYITTTPISSLSNTLPFKYRQEISYAYWGSDFAQVQKYVTDYDNDLITSNASNVKTNGFESRYIVYPKNRSDKHYVNSCALLSLDPCVVPSIRNILDGSEFGLKEEYEATYYFGTPDLEDANLKGSEINYKNAEIWAKTNSPKSEQTILNKCVFISSNTGVKEMDGIGFSNVAGSATDISKYGFTSYPIGVWTNYKKRRGKDNNSPVNWYNLGDNFNTVDEGKITASDGNDIDYLVDNNVGFNSILNVNIVRGLFTPYIGTNNTNLQNSIYSIQTIQPTNENSEVDWDKSFFIREQDESPYYTISDRFKLPISVTSTNHEDEYVKSAYRGDCFSNTVSMRIIRNFIDPTAPIADTIVDTWCWNQYVRKAGDRGDGDDWEKLNGEPKWNEVNTADVNTVDLGYWVTFKCLSSYNLGLRSLDYSNVDEMKLLGSPRSFYPLNGGSTATGNKAEESFLLNDGLSATVGEKTYNLLPDVPYFKSEFANRIIFSNVQIDDAFNNGYRTFQGLSYKDYDKQYGEIVKLVPWDNNLLVVMEHGVGMVGVNEQALMQTNTNDTIHIYGHGVLSDQMQIISPDYGSKYEHSVIRTPIGVYGIDTDARKIWRFSSQKGFETLSDMKIESYLNDNMFTNSQVEMEVCDVRTHYNLTKGDLMFTFFKKKTAKVANKKEIQKQNYTNTSKLTFKEIGEKQTVTIYSRSTPIIETYGNYRTTITDLGNGNYSVEIESTGDGTGAVNINGSKIEMDFISEAEQYAAEQAAIEETIEEDETPLTLKIGGTAVFKMAEGEVIYRNVTINKAAVTIDKLELLSSDDNCVELSVANGRLRIKALKKTNLVSVWVKYGNVTSTKVHIEVTPKKELVIDQGSEITVITGTMGSFSADNVDNITAEPTNGAEHVDNVKSRGLAVTFTGVSAGDTKFKVTGYIDGEVVGTKYITAHIVDDVPITGITWPAGTPIQGKTITVTLSLSNDKPHGKTYTWIPNPSNYNKKRYTKSIGPAIENGSFVGDHSIASIYGGVGQTQFIPVKLGHCKYELVYWGPDGNKISGTKYYFDVTVTE